MSLHRNLATKLFCLLLAATVIETRAQTTIVSETFEGTFPGGWSVGASNSAGSTAYWGKVDLRSFGSPPARGGNYALYCAGVGYGGTTLSPVYRDSMDAYLSRTINLSNFSTASLSFWYVIPRIEEGVIFAPYDELRVTIDGTEVFVRKTAQTNWTQATVNLSAYVGGIHTLTFEFTSDGSTHYEGAYLDDILVTADDPNGRIAGALALGSITNTVSVGGAISFPGDVDMFAINVVAGQRISFDIDRPSGSALDSVLRVFDSAGNQLPGGFNDDGRGPGETSSVESYLEYTFTNSGTYYVGVSSYPNTNYSAVTGTNDAVGNSTGNYVLVVSPGLAGNIQTTGAAVDILGAGTNPLALDTTKRTWVVIHGWNSSRGADNIVSVTTNLVQARSGEQILTLDWSAAADTGILDPDHAAGAIVPVAQWAANALTNAGFRGTNLNLVGHSFGSYVADEIAQRIPGGVNSIVALDPAANVAPGFFDPVSNNEINFARDSAFSWAFHASSAGNEYTPATADEAFIVESGTDTKTAHHNVVSLFAYLLSNPSDVVGRFFLLNNLLSATPGPWLQNQYVSPFLFDNPVQGYEADIQTTDAGLTPVSISFVATPPAFRVNSVSTLAVSNGEAIPLMGKGTDFGATLAGNSAVTNYFTLSNSGGTNLILQGVSVPNGFQILTAPVAVVPWNQSTVLGIRFAPGAAGTFSGNVFITNNATGSAPFRFAITGTATNPVVLPSITSHPNGQVASAGNIVLLSVAATNALSYQWQKNGQPVAAATNATLTLTNVSRSSGGIYSVIASNQLGGVTSSNVLVRVLVPQRFVQAPFKLGNGQMRLAFGDQDGFPLTVNELTNFVVEAATNALSTNWLRYTNGFTIVGGQVQFDDPDSAGQPRRFYRVMER